MSKSSNNKSAVIANRALAYLLTDRKIVKAKVYDEYLELEIENDGVIKLKADHIHKRNERGLMQDFYFISGTYEHG